MDQTLTSDVLWKEITLSRPAATGPGLQARRCETARNGSENRENRDGQRAKRTDSPPLLRRTLGQSLLMQWRRLRPSAVARNAKCVPRSSPCASPPNAHPEAVQHTGDSQGAMTRTAALPRTQRREPAPWVHTGPWTATGLTGEATRARTTCVPDDVGEQNGGSSPRSLRSLGSER